MTAEFSGKIGIVTGAASGLGRQTALALAERGARLLLFDRDAAGLSETAAECPGAVTVCGDAARAVEAAVAAAARLGPIAILANAADILGPANPLTDVAEADWDRLFEINVKGTWLALRATLPHMRAAGGGSIVYFASAAGLTGSETMPAYSASKGAIVMLTRSAARIADQLEALSNAGLDGVLLIWVDFIDGIGRFTEGILPLLEQRGLHTPFVPSARH